MADEFPIIAIADPGGEKSEPMGTKRKFWVTWQDKRWLFKYNRSNHGEDWSEKISAEIAELLRMAHGKVELAECAGEPGVISQNFVDDVAAGGRLVHGNELLSNFYQGIYPINRSYKVNQHCIPAIREILGKYNVSGTLLECGSGAIKTLWHMFAGYLMLDALIGNTDRHHENWGLITRSFPPESPTVLAPSFDHASSLGREISDADRGDMLSGVGNRNISLYAGRCRSKMYLNSDALKPLAPLEAFREATADTPTVRALWLGRLAAVGPGEFTAIISRVPARRMSTAAGRFALELLVYNRARLLELD